MVVDLGIGSTQVQIAEVKIHSLVLRNCLGTRQTSLNQWICVFELRAVVQHAKRPHEAREVMRGQQVVLVKGQQVQDGEQVAFELRFLIVEDCQCVDDIDKSSQAQTLIHCWLFFSQLVYFPLHSYFHQLAQHGLTIELASAERRNKLIEASIVQGMNGAEERRKSHFIEGVQLLDINRSGVQIYFYFCDVAENRKQKAFLQISRLVKQRDSLSQAQQEVFVDILATK